MGPGAVAGVGPTALGYGRSISLAGIWPLLLDSDGHLN